MKKLGILFLIFCIVLIVAVVYDMQETTETQFVLDTVSTITVDGNKKEVVDRAFRRVREIEEHMTSYSETSDLATGNITRDTSYVISKGIEYGKISDGSFDITIKPICDLWNINGDSPKVPAQEEIEQALQFVDYRKVVVNDGNLAMPEGMKLELGAIAKGYAADEACRVLREAGIDDGIVDLGGNIVALGEKKVGIRNPLAQNDGDYFATVKIHDCAVATSGGYERYFEQDGVRYHHIFDPSSGYPVETDVLSATVICPKAIDADCWSTILFSAGVEKAEDYAEAYGLTAVLIDVNCNVYVFGNADFTLEKSSDFNIVKK